MNKIGFVGVLGFATLAAIGCASSGSATSGASRSMIAADELATAGDVSLYDALNRLRPPFLRPRPAPGTQLGRVMPTVYFDGLQYPDGVEGLKSLNARSIQEVRFLEPQQANARFGTQNNAGALIVTSKK